ncbi:MAG: NAD-dependent epimerase/dehydratase family protein [bacterium]|nr:NAD-dependent epimerase/dehydratase family protein [bacterium]
MTTANGAPGTLRVLLTGGAGFLGRAILREFSKLPDVEVRVLDRAPLDPERFPDVEFRVGDIVDYETVVDACRDVDVVLHAASQVDWGHTTREALEAVNVGGTRTVIGACREAGVAGLVYTSSMDVVCGTEPLSGVDERHPYPARFTNEYSRTKAVAEQEVLAADDATLRTCALRPCGLFGEGDPYHVANVLDVLEKDGLPFRIGDGTARFQHVYVGNVAHAHVLAARALLAPESPLRGEAYFLTDDCEAINFLDFMEPIVEALGHRLPPKSRRMPYSILFGVGALMEAAAWVVRGLSRLAPEGSRVREKVAFAPVLTRSSVRFLCHDHVFDGSKARRDLDYKPIYGEAEALERTIAWFRDER